MPRYRIRDGEQLAHGGVVLQAGAFVDLPAAIARDGAVSASIEEVDAKGQPVAASPIDDLGGYRSHERVGILRERLTAAQAVVDGIQAQLEAEAQQLSAAVAAASKKPAAAPPAAPTKEQGS